MEHEAPKTKQVASNSRLLVLWIILTTILSDVVVVLGIGFFGGLSIVGAVPDFKTIPIFAFPVSLIMGAVHWALIRKRIPHSVFWVLFNLLGTLLATILLWVISAFFLDSGQGPADLDGYFDLLLFALLNQLFVGLLQGSHQVKATGAWRWAIWPVARIISISISGFTFLLAFSQYSDGRLSTPIALILYLLPGFSFAVITGLTISWLTKSPKTTPI